MACVITTYLLFCFTGLIEGENIISVFAVDAKARDQIGIALISVWLLNFLIDLIPIVSDIKSDIKKKLHFRKVRKILRSRSKSQENYDKKL